MVFRRFFYSFVLILLCCSFLFKERSEQRQFISESLSKSIEKMLDYHVEYKKFTPEVALRSFKVFIDQFDSLKIYLLRSEIDVYVSMPYGDLKKVTKLHKSGNYQSFYELNECIRLSIYRAREIRRCVRQRLLESDLSLDCAEPKEIFAASSDELVERNYQKLRSFLLAEMKIEGVSDFSKEQRSCLLDLCENRFQKQEQKYLEGEEALVMRVLKAFAKSLDAHSSFFSPDEAFDLKLSLEKQFEGIGIVLRESVRGIAIKSLVKNSPAEKSGKIRPGDVLLSIDGASASELSYEEVLSKLKGEIGQEVHLLLQRSSGTNSVKCEVSLAREKILMEDDRVQYSSLPFGRGIVGTVEIPSFYEGEAGSCASDVKQAINDLNDSGELLGLVLDMRENSGGFLSQAVKVASLFMSGGIVVVSKYADDQKQYLRNTNGKIFYQKPLVILVSKASASAAEIVTQALQDYGIAVVVGDSRTYGKGTVQYQTVTGKNQSTLFKVTVGRYYTVSGKSTQIEGVKSDVHVPTSYAPYNIGEKYLSYPLQNDQIHPVYKDPLTDLKTSERSSMKKSYLLNMQKKLSIWSLLVPQLKKNSEYRIHHSEDFKSFLTDVKKQKQGIEMHRPFQDQGDVQMNEALYVLKDMIYHESVVAKKVKSRKRLH